MKMTFNPYTGKIASKVRQIETSKKKGGKKQRDKVKSKISSLRKNGKWMA